ncbi:MAG: DUF898 domain-containing protein [Proteobacteria bacterium]|nr:DUF898 domain-containing protein [Pseudomonadota bacterium]
MSDSEAPVAPVTHAVAFHGKGTEYFRIWIVNVALTVMTLGIYSAWAKVRTQRYFYGNTYLAGHSFEYHAKAWRILLGRAIALVLLVGYTVSAILLPVTMGMWILLLAAALPWLVRSAIRFNARNTSWRNVRFNFQASFFEAFMAYVVWSVVAVSVFPLIPYARRIHDYFYVNHHSFGGRKFATDFSVGRTYLIYLYGFLAIVALLVAIIAAAFAIISAQTYLHDFLSHIPFPAITLDYPVLTAVALGLGGLFVATFVATMVTNLVIGNTTLEGGHSLASNASPWRVGWIVVSNTVLTLATLGLFYPFARIRLARYRMGRYALHAASDLDDFTSEALAQQSAIGQEIAGFFDLGFGL